MSHQTTDDLLNEAVIARLRLDIEHNQTLIDSLIAQNDAIMLQISHSSSGQASEQQRLQLSKIERSQKNAEKKLEELNFQLACAMPHNIPTRESNEYDLERTLDAYNEEAKQYQMEKTLKEIQETRTRSVDLDERER